MAESKWHDEAAAQWNRFAPDWHSRSRAMWETGSRKTILPLFTRLVSPGQGRVLDAGCGDGYASWKLAAAGYTVVGVDIAEEMVAFARSGGPASLPVSFVRGSVDQLPFDDGSFAGILAINVLEFTESPLAALRECHRLLAPGGVLLMGILGPTAAPRAFSYPRLYGRPAIQNTMMPWEARQLAEENGFAVAAVEPVYKEGVTPDIAERLSDELRQAVSFLTLFALKKEGNPPS